MTDAEVSAVARELERLRGELTPIAADLAEVKTSLAVLAERSQRVDQDVRDLRSTTDDSVQAVRDEVEALKARRWPIPAVTVLCGIAGPVLALVALLS